jgi:DNA (cytosine-5)-methyltransferase 1
LFLDYIRLLKEKRPKFFVCENVPGILFQKNKQALELFCDGFKEAGYDISITKYNAKNYGDCQDRERVIFFGIRSDLGLSAELKLQSSKVRTLKDGIDDLKDTAVAAATGNKANSDLSIPNHEYYVGDFSSMFMSRNRVRSWEEPGFTV